MPRDADDDLADDEYEPRKRRREPRPSSTGTVIVLVVAAVVLAGVGIWLTARNREAADRARQAAGEADATAAREAAVRVAERPLAVEKPRSNWEKVIGTWVREPGPQDKGGRPYRFEFRKDQTALTIRTNIDGNPQQHDGRIEVLADQGTRLMLRMEIPNGAISYTFQFKPNGTIVLDSSAGDLVFTRLK
jgi:type II secretory pathway pseudopilin PulG